MLYYRARWYDPGQGRFLSEDPLRFAGGDFNLYSYVGNRPIQVRDPSGAIAWIPVIIGVAGAVMGGITEGREAYERNCRGWQLGEAILRGSIAGGVGALAGLVVSVYSGPVAPVTGSVASSVVNDVINGAWQGEFKNGEFDWGKTGKNAARAGVFGIVSAGLVPNVQGGSNFNPLTSPRTFGPKAQDLYSEEAINYGLEEWWQLVQSARRSARTRGQR
jgi:hypothetical protein